MDKYVMPGKSMNRHMEFTRRIFMDITVPCRPEGKADPYMTLDELLEHIFDMEEN